MNYIDAECTQIPIWEGNENFLYLDSDDPPNATTGQGYLVTSHQVSLSLPWKKADGIAASATEIAKDWLRVTALPGGHVAKFYRSAAGLFLTQTDIDALTCAYVLELDRPLHLIFPAFDTFPLSGQIGIADMAYNLGIGEPASEGRPATRFHAYHEFIAVVNSSPPNWLAAAQQCCRDKSDPAFNVRNSWTIAQFIQASKESM